MKQNIQPVSNKTLISEIRWSRTLARVLSPRKHLRVLPTRTRPSLFGGD